MKNLKIVVKVVEHEFSILICIIEESFKKLFYWLHTELGIGLKNLHSHSYLRSKSITLLRIFKPIPSPSYTAWIFEKTVLSIKCQLFNPGIDFEWESVQIESLNRVIHIYFDITYVSTGFDCFSKQSLTFLSICTDKNISYLKLSQIICEMK